MSLLKKTVYLIIFSCLGCQIHAQKSELTSQLVSQYEQYKEPSLNMRRIKHEDITPLIKTLKDKPGVAISQVGSSIDGRSLNLLSLGTGKTSIFLWSQMHGDESTATQAIFDILRFFTSPTANPTRDLLLKKLNLHFLPMLNPDGAALFTRRNTLGIDINRDALDLASPEGQTLKRVRDSLSANFGFNLHDQSRYYNTERTAKPATISYLAPAYNYEKDIMK